MPKIERPYLFYCQNCGEWIYATIGAEYHDVKGKKKKFCGPMWLVGRVAMEYDLEPITEALVDLLKTLEQASLILHELREQLGTVGEGQS